MSLALIRTTPAVELNPEQQRAVEHGIGDPRRSRAAARRRRRGLGQDRDAGASGGRAHSRRRRSEADHARHIFPPRGGGAWPAGRAASRPASRARGRRRGDAGLCRHVSRHRRPAPARICAPARPRSAVHHPRPRGFGRPHELGAARSRARQTRRSAFRPRRPASPSIRASSTRAANSRPFSANGSPGSPRTRRRCGRCFSLMSR